MPMPLIIMLLSSHQFPIFTAEVEGLSWNLFVSGVFKSRQTVFVLFSMYASPGQNLCCHEYCLL